MRPPSSLFAKILSWFFLNLLLLAGLLGIFFAVQPQMNLHQFFGQQGSDRLRAAGMLIAHDLEQAPPDEWSAVLARHAEIHGVDFMLLLRDGLIFSPSAVKIPEEVLAKAQEILQRRGPLEQHGNAPCASQSQPQCPLPGTDGGRQAWPHEGFGHRPHLIMRTRMPTRYWFGIRVPLLAAGWHKPSLLLASSGSITGNGFFFDPLPWMVVAAAVVATSVLFWIPLVRNITRPLVRMTRAAEEIARGNFAVAIHEPRSDEIGRLASTINNMTARLAAFVKGQRRFLGDVSHELGSPVARIQFGLGILEQRVDEANRERVRDVMEDVDHMSRLIGELLAFSRAEMNARAVELQQIALLPAVQAAVRRECPPSAEVELRIDPEIQVVASAELLTRAIANLLRNAVRHAGSAGPVTVLAEERSSAVTVTVSDCGPGVAQEHLGRLFEPFFRPEPSRDRDSGGVGLGLAIVKTCIESCGGTVSARNLQPKGFAVAIVLNA